jgi:serine/threonine protein kinase
MTSPQLKSSSSYTNQKNIGSGSFGIVSRIRVEENGKVYALKELHLKKLTNKALREEALKEAINEYNLLKKEIKNVVKSYGSHYDEQDKVFKFSMEYFPHNLSEYVDINGCLTPKQYLPLFLDMVEGN